MANVVMDPIDACIYFIKKGEYRKTYPLLKSMSKEDKEQMLFNLLMETDLSEEQVDRIVEFSDRLITYYQIAVYSVMTLNVKTCMVMSCAIHLNDIVDGMSLMERLKGVVAGDDYDRKVKAYAIIGIASELYYKGDDD